LCWSADGPAGNFAFRDRNVRPTVPEQVYRNDAGQVIDDGNRWRAEAPPEDASSVALHPERFAPLHQVADALIAYLAATYDVSVSDCVEVTARCRSKEERPITTGSHRASRA
jgi:hypothetical protein